MQQGLDLVPALIVGELNLQVGPLLWREPEISSDAGVVGPVDESAQDDAAAGVTENIRAELVSHGIHPKHARHAAMFHLAADMPTPVLAELLGLAPITATRWAILSSRNWAQYTAMRHTSHHARGE
ncbi:hypothetical protein ABZ894_25990 [Nocardia beijingensis]|uniref:hypothetical protein n=1 Tax=Nocardia beijingensis TaxID=95162 RepID=UPI003405D427